MLVPQTHTPKTPNSNKSNLFSEELIHHIYYNLLMQMSLFLDSTLIPSSLCLFSLFWFL